MQFGRNITKNGDQLQSIAITRLYQGLSNPKPAFRDLVEQLRTVKTIDEKRYKELKKQLPYFVCGLFHPPIRRFENFVSIQYFMLDLDHLEAAEINKQVLCEQLQVTPEVLMYFTSPSGDGLKIMFQLAEPCTDRVLFSSFYKLFAARFAEKYGLHEVIDLRTSDVTRACFMSYDPHAYFQEEVLSLDLKVFIPDLDFDKASQAIKEAEKALAIPSSSALRQVSLEPENDVLLKIKQKLNPNFRPPRQKQYYVPPQIDEIMPTIETKLADLDIQWISADPISYGRKVQVKAGKIWAEINVFHGKNGFKVVPTTKSGSNTELALMTAQLIEQILSEMIS